MRKLILSLILMSLSSVTLAGEKFPEYKLGEGAQYSMMVDGQPADVKMAFIKRSDSKLVIEIEMNMDGSQASGMAINMVQQFHLGLSGGKIKILKAFMKIPNIPKPQILPAEYLKGYDGAQMNSFLISSKSDIAGNKLGTLDFPTPEGTVEATHYRRTSNGQDVDFWITEDSKIKPMSLLMMKSKGTKKEQNYTLKFKGLVKGYKSKINATEAEPLNALGRMFLPVLLSNTNFLN